MDFCGRGELADRQQKLGQLMSALKKIAEQFNVAVVITNQVSAARWLDLLRYRKPASRVCTLPVRPAVQPVPPHVSAQPVISVSSTKVSAHILQHP